MAGVCYLFMPPLQKLEEYLELVAVIEATAEELQCPILLEGYEPPSDPRLCNFRITPDPGVIEVNVQPSASWEELVERTEFLYEQARLTRLTTEKFIDRRPAHRHRRRQPLRARRGDTGGFAVPASPGPAAQPAQLLA